MGRKRIVCRRNNLHLGSAVPRGRIYMEWPVTIGDWSAPKSVSWVAFIVAGGLAIFGFRFTAGGFTGLSFALSFKLFA
jgi:hypothetical protein